VPALGFVPLLLVRDGGMALQVSGINDPVGVDMRWFMWNKTYITPLYGRCVPERDFPKLLRHSARKELKLDEMVTGVYKLERLDIAFRDMLEGTNPKNVIVMD
jgi:S-(hydroxymethyl)glutathione dehydrogenase/alcohol dehydrogenase